VQAFQADGSQKLIVVVLKIKIERREKYVEHEETESAASRDVVVGA
jgi:hypothetical protein